MPKECSFFMWVRAYSASLIKQSLQIDALVDPVATSVDHMTAHSYISKA